MNNGSFANSGGLFARKKKSEKSPDFGGDITLGLDLIEYLNQCYQSGKEPKLELSAWRRMGRGNTSFMSLKVNIPYEVRQGGQNVQNRSYQSGYSASQAPQRQGYGPGPAFTNQPNAPRNNDYAQQSGRGQQFSQSNDLDDEIPF